eukprot:1601221-Alexandrium_andersonii.AAC.1
MCPACAVLNQRALANQQLGLLRGSVVPDTSRDHPCEGRGRSHHHIRGSPTAPGASELPVSYTHLTLPTIC